MEQNEHVLKGSQVCNTFEKSTPGTSTNLLEIIIGREKTTRQVISDQWVDQDHQKVNRSIPYEMSVKRRDK